MRTQTLTFPTLKLNYRKGLEFNGKTYVSPMSFKSIFAIISKFWDCSIIMFNSNFACTLQQLHVLTSGPWLRTNALLPLPSCLLIKHFELAIPMGRRNDQSSLELFSNTGIARGFLWLSKPWPALSLWFC